MATNTGALLSVVTLLTGSLHDLPVRSPQSSECARDTFPADVTRTAGLAHGDMDGDGDLDLGFGNPRYAGRTRLRLNLTRQLHAPEPPRVS